MSQGRVMTSKLPHLVVVVIGLAKLEDRRHRRLVLRDGRGVPDHDQGVLAIGKWVFGFWDELVRGSEVI